MATKKVVLYFDNSIDALHFTLAAGSVIAGDRRGCGTHDIMDVIQEMERASRITVLGTLTSGNPRSPEENEALCADHEPSLEPSEAN